jgi:hypothetical protein
VRTSVLDLTDDAAAQGRALPDAVDVAVAADLLYSEELARAVARTCARLVERGAALIVTDSQLRWAGAFEDELARCLGREVRPFERRPLGAITGWSYAEGADATHEVTVGVLEVSSRAAAAASAVNGVGG